MNLGTLLFVVLWDVLLYFIYLILVLFRVRSRFSRALKINIQRSVLWNSLIVFIQETYIDLLFGVALNFTNFLDKWSSSDEIFTNILTIIFAVLLLVAPLFLVFFIWPRFKNLRKRHYRNKYGSMYEMVNLKGESTVLTWCLFFFLRRMLFVLGILVFDGIVVFQIMCLVYPTVAVLICIG